MMEKTMKWSVVVLMVASVATAQEPLKPLERIGIRPSRDGAQFILKRTGTPSS